MCRGTKMAIFMLLILTIKEFRVENDILEEKTKNLIETINDMVEEVDDKEIVEEVEFFRSKFKEYHELFKFIKKDIRDLSLRLVDKKNESLTRF